MSKNKFNVVFRNRLYIIGALGGYFYWHYIGCSTGTCPITSTWAGTSVSGAILGSLVSGMFVKDEDTQE